jgi:hypothetical protein
VRGTRRRGLFEPWGLALYRNGLYAVGRWSGDAAAASDEGPRVHAVERFRRAERRREARFEVPAAFSLDAFFAGAFGIFPGGAPESISLIFDGAVAPLVQGRRYHPSQTNRRLPDGRVRVRLRLPISPEVVSWLVGWGPRVEVEAPASLHEQVLAEHAAACRAALR